jgi:hypothetical protein
MDDKLKILGMHILRLKCKAITTNAAKHPILVEYYFLPKVKKILFSKLSNIERDISSDKLQLFFFFFFFFIYKIKLYSMFSSPLISWQEKLYMVMKKTML